MSILLAHLMSRPWAMYEPYLERIKAVLEAREGLGLTVSEVSSSPSPQQHGIAESIVSRWGSRPHDRRAVVDVQSQAGESRYVRAGSVAIVPIGGVLHKYASQVNSESGERGTSYEAIRRAVDEAVSQSWCSTLLLAIDSPGGSTDGLEQMADHLYSLRKRAEKRGSPRVVAHVDGMIASAAYWLGSQCESIWITPGSWAGSIGVYMTMVDSSEAWKARGYKVHLVKAGEFKGAGASGVPVSDAHLADFGREVTDLYADFKHAIVRGRPALAESIDKIASGQMWLAREAVPMGLVDRVATLDACIEQLNNKSSGVTRAASAGTSNGTSGATRVRVVRAGSVLRVVRGTARKE